MRIVRPFAVLTLAVCPGLLLSGCQPSTATAPMQPTLVSIAVAPGSASVPIGSTQALTVTGTLSDASTLDLTCGSTFTSSAATIAAVDNQGLVTAKAAGTATITATHSGAGGGCAQIASGKTATARITVPTPPLVSIGLTPASRQLTPGAIQALSVNATYSDGSTSTLTSGVTFQTSDNSIASVSNAGLVTARSPGTATITATQTASGKTATAAIDVIALFTTINFESNPPPTLRGFNGAEASSVTADPTGGANKVAQVVRSATADTFAGTVVSTGVNETAGKIPLDAANTRMTVRVYSPGAGIHVRLKLESSADTAVSVETEALTTVAGTWETLTFDFASPIGPQIDLANTYDRVVIFFNFGVSGATAGVQTYYFDDMTFIGGTSSGSFSTITFDSVPPPTLTGFAGADVSTVAVDPTGGTNKVGKVLRSATALTYAGTTVSTGANQTVGRIPFSATSKRMTVRVYSPGGGITVRLKAENAASGNTIFVETEATTTVANTWETLTFDFAHPVGTAVNLASSYNRLTIFFNFGVTGAVAGAQTYYFDDVTFLP